MFHDGCGSEIPRDDAPRVVDVVYNPNLGEYLEVGVGRPRIMYVLYPTDQGEVLCRGAVLPYYEFRSPKRLDDGEWRALLRSDKAPRPAFAQASFGGTGLYGHTGHWKWTLTLCAAVLAGVVLFVRRRRRRRRTARVSASA